MRQVVLCAALLFEACGFFDAPGDPVVEAHRGGAAYFPQNSAAAIYNAVAKKFPGVEFDLALTADRVPVLAHDPWLNPILCTRSDGTPLPGAKAERIFIRDLSLEELRAGFLCGGVRDQSEPGAAVVAEPLMTFDELISAMREAPAMLVHIDVKYEPGMTAGPEAFADEILSRWRGAALPNPWYASSDVPEEIAALEAHSAEGAVETALGWPRFPPDAGNEKEVIGLGGELAGLAGLDTLAGLARSAGADGIAVPYQLADRAQIEVARDAGLEVRLWTLNSRALLETYCRWPVDSVITDMPEAAPCL